MTQKKICLTTTITHQTKILSRADIPAKCCIPKNKIGAKRDHPKHVKCYPDRSWAARDFEMCTQTTQWNEIYPKKNDRVKPQNEVRAASWTCAKQLLREKKKPLSNHRIIYIHPFVHQTTHYHATEPYIQYTVTTNTQHTAELSRNIKQQPTKTSEHSNHWPPKSQSAESGHTYKIHKTSG